MPKYRTLAPVSYMKDGVAVHVTKAGRVIDLTVEQAAELEGLVEYIPRSGAPSSDPVARIYEYESLVDFPTVGQDSGVIYFDRGTATFYVYSDSDGYTAVGS